MPNNVTTLIVTVEWDGGDHPYYTPHERVVMLREWIDAALIDRDDNPIALITEVKK